MKYILVRTHKRIDDEKHVLYPRHPIMWIFNEENVFDNVALAELFRKGLEHPEDYIIIPFY